MLLLALGSVPAVSAQTDPLIEIRACVEANFPARNFRQQVRLSSTDAAGGEQVLQARLYGVRGESSQLNLMLSVEQPQDLSGARYLLLSRSSRDDMYVYLPAMDRVRRIMGGMRGQPLWGTDFSYEDIKHLQAGLNKTQTRYLGAGSKAGRELHRLQVDPDPLAESGYQKIEIDLDVLTCLIVEARFFDDAGLSKRLSSATEAFRQVDGRWIFGDVRMQSLRNGTHSRLEVSEVVFDQSLPRTLFNPKTFYLAR